jgi:CheY-like chemotaxis protein
VLYVDDEEALVKLAGRVLKKLGYTVTGFTDPLEAVKAFKAGPDQFDIAVTDLAMPHLSGFDVSRQLLAVRRTLPIVMTSGYMRSQDQELAELIGVRELILKPNSIEDLGLALDRIFREAVATGDKQLR